MSCGHQRRISFGDATPLDDEEAEANMVLPPLRYTVNVNFKTTPLEDEVFEVVRTAAHELARQTGEPVIKIRVAGGWVRDKLLGTESDDIDFAFSDISGLQFAGHVNEVLKSRGLPVSDLESDAIRNSEQSAHLETVCIGIAGLEIDMNALRRERYNPTSRIPEITPGTVTEDATRRDFTINAMFYKFGPTPKEDCIEDPTGHGMRDMRRGVVRTNIDPVQSFTDDPLRMLRCVRYVSRYSFRMDPEVQKVFDFPPVRRQFRALVSRQLTMRELFKMLHQDERADAIKLLGDVGLEAPIADPQSPDDEAVGGSFMDDVLPVHILLKSCFGIPVQKAFNTSLIPTTIKFLSCWDELKAAVPAEDNRYSTLAYDIATVAVYVAATMNAHIAQFPLPSPPVFGYEDGAKPIDPKVAKKMDKAHSNMLKKMDSFLTEQLPLTTSRDSKLLRHATRTALGLAEILRQVEPHEHEIFQRTDQPSPKYSQLKLALGNWLREFLDVDFNDCQAGAEEVLSLRIVSAPLVHASNVPWRAVLMMATCILSVDNKSGSSSSSSSSEAACLEKFGRIQRIIETEHLEEIAAPLPVLNGVEVRSALASHLGREVAPGPIIGLLVQKVFDFQIEHSVELARGQPRLPRAAGDDTEADSAAAAGGGNQAEDGVGAGAGAVPRSAQVDQLVFTDSVTREACIKAILEDADVKAELERAAARAAAGSKQKKKKKKR